MRPGPWSYAGHIALGAALLLALVSWAAVLAAVAVFLVAVYGATNAPMVMVLA